MTDRAQRTCLTCKHHGWGAWGDSPEPYCYHPLSRQTEYRTDEVRGRYVVKDIATTCYEMRSTKCGQAGALWKEKRQWWRFW